MRPIDADALIDGFKHMGYDASEHPEDSYMEGWCKGFNSAVDHCIHHAIHAKTFEDHTTGRWIKTPVYHGDDTSGFVEYKYTCSKCGVEAPLLPDIYLIDLSDYCPNCGAKMEA